MSKKISEKVNFITKIFGILTLIFFSSIAIAMESENGNEQEHPLQQKYNLRELFNHIASENEHLINLETDHVGHKKLFKLQQGALTDLLKKDSKESWNAVVEYFAERDFLLETLYSFRKLSHSEILNNLAMEQDSWGYHARQIGNLLENFGESLVTDQRFGPAFKNLLSCKFKMTTFVYLKSLAHVVQEAKDADVALKDSIHNVQETVKTYLESNNLLKKA